MILLLEIFFRFELEGAQLQKKNPLKDDQLFI